jgi:transcriptional regulator with GAF, ATPase, and Fis domain
LKLASALPDDAEETGDFSVPPNKVAKIATLKMFEKNYIAQVLDHCNGQISGKNGAAQLLDLPPSTLRSKMKKLGINTS